MRRIRLYCNPIESGPVDLSADESRHASRVLRLPVGSPVELFDGAGMTGEAIITRIQRDLVRVEVSNLERMSFDLPIRLTLAVAMTKQHRQAYLIEKCTELGVAAIWPIVTARSIAKPATAAVSKWRRRAIEAAKQSGSAWVPDVEVPQSLQNVIERCGAFDHFCFSDISPSAAPLAQIVSAIPSQGSLLVAVGPEGGWSNEERAQAKHASATVVSLAATQLRTETAAVAVCACVAMSARR